MNNACQIATAVKNQNVSGIHEMMVQKMVQKNVSDLKDHRPSATQYLSLL